MKQKFLNKKPKKLNIPLRRKVAILYNRILLIGKILLALFVYLLFFTKYLNFVKHDIAQHIYELTSDIGFKLENVLIEGQQNTTSEDILSSLNADRSTPLFAIDLHVVKDQLEKNAWIKAASVERKLPDTIYITLLERVPIAIWQINQKLFLIDEEGFVLANSNIEKFSSLPHVVGIDANVYAGKLIEDLIKAPELSDKLISAVRYGERRWNLIFQQNITVKMPELGFEKALNYLVELHKVNKLFDQGYKVIDLRDENKFYVEKF
jgi:cell division protein FtsQ